MTFLSIDQIETPLGPMIAIGNKQALYLLEFSARCNIKHEIEKLQTVSQASIISGKTDSIDSIRKELQQYFKGELSYFHTPLKMTGTSFQIQVWLRLKKIPFGTTCSYSDIAQEIQKPTSIRAVGGANAANQLAIVIPCHRVISSRGELTGYAGGLSKKQWLIDHERKHRYG
ncbi:MAG: methylated-DNA--[protein]-cysteine S-methyltransferase [Chlamydiales bacterium]|nr:methylated-DNA--[protein]-cysteine S-methyltransferase [Chlamydiales bacterium]